MTQQHTAYNRNPNLILHDSCGRIAKLSEALVSLHFRSSQSDNDFEVAALDLAIERIKINIKNQEEYNMKSHGHTPS